MDGTTFLALASLCAPLVHPSTAQALVTVESSFNPNAIGVVSGVLVRQPRDLSEAIATATALRTNGWNFSIGLAQINVRTLNRLGLSIGNGFDACKNLAAMQTVLAECRERLAPNTEQQSALRQVLSCYYSGNFTTGFRHGYVNRVVVAAQAIARGPP